MQSSFTTLSISPTDDIFELCRNAITPKIETWLNLTENDPNQSDEHLFTPLHWACMYGHDTIADMLICKGAKIPMLNMGDDTPLHIASQFRKATVVKLLLGRIKLSSQSTSEFTFYTAGDVVNLQNHHGNTALHYACFNSDAKIAKLLLDHGALANIQNNYGKTALDLARGEVRQLIDGSVLTTDSSEILNRSATLSATLSKTRHKLIPGVSNGGSLIGSGTMLRVGHMTMKHDNILLNCLTAKGKFSEDILHEYLRYKWNQEDVVVKLIRASNEMLHTNPDTKEPEITPRVQRTFAEEYLKLRIFSNQYIIPVLGIVNSASTIGVVYPYMPGGSLFSIIHRDYDDVVSNPVSNEQLYKWALDVVNGMVFLHSLNEKEQLSGFHLTGHSVFIDSETNIAKLNMGDTLFSFQQTPARVKYLHPAYLAPEVLQQAPSEINFQAAHMWSFAVLLWEIESREYPFGEYSPMEIGLKIAFEDFRLELDGDGHIAKLFKICAHEDPKKRPTFDKIVGVLEKLLIKLNHVQ